MELVVDLGERSYPIIIEDGLLDRVDIEIKKVFNGNKIFILTDENVNKYYGDAIESKLKDVKYEVRKYVESLGLERILVKPVSYTHLTLPTKA